MQLRDQLQDVQTRAGLETHADAVADDIFTSIAQTEDKLSDQAPEALSATALSSMTEFQSQNPALFTAHTSSAFRHSDGIHAVTVRLLGGPSPRA